jgi:hypothetical protein
LAAFSLRICGLFSPYLAALFLRIWRPFSSVFGGLFPPYLAALFLRIWRPFSSVFGGLFSSVFDCLFSVFGGLSSEFGGLFPTYLAVIFCIFGAFFVYVAAFLFFDEQSDTRFFCDFVYSVTGLSLWFLFRAHCSYASVADSDPGSGVCFLTP